MGQPVLTLGLSGEEGFVPLDSELFISAAKAKALHQPFKDGRSRAAKRYRIARNQTKLQMAKAMIHRAVRAGIKADYLLADAWFGNKTTIRTAEESLLTAVVRMKKDTMKYRLTEIQAGQAVHREVAVKTLYQACIRGQWEKIPGQPYQAKALDVGLNLSESPKEPERWIKVRLLFVRGVVHGEQAQAGKHDWAVFLTTDPGLAPQRILELYALRWAVEVYFKEAKQHLGFLKEQSNHYAAYIASIHLTAIRFCTGDRQDHAPGQRDCRYSPQNLGQRPSNQLRRAVMAGLSGDHCGRAGGIESPAGGYRHAHHGDDRITRTVLFCASPAT